MPAITLETANEDGGGSIGKDEIAGILAFGKKFLKLQKQMCPVNKNPRAPSRGALKKSLNMVTFGQEGEGQYTVLYEGLDYIEPLIYGSRPHKIVASGKALAFFWDLNLRFHQSISTHEFGSPLPKAPRTQLKLPPKGFRYTAGGKAARLTVRHSLGVRPNREDPMYLRTQHGALTNITAPKGRTESGKVMFKSVNHPGTRANDFVSRAYDAVSDETDELMEGFAGKIDMVLGNMKAESIL